MGRTGKQDLTTPTPPVARKESTPVNVTPLRDDLLGASQAYVKQAVYEKRPYLKYAFLNPYNLSLLLGGLLAAGLTLSPFLALVVVCLEILWVVFAPDSKLLQRYLWMPQFGKEKLTRERQKQDALIKSLAEADQKRVGLLTDHQNQIKLVAAENPSFTGEMLAMELDKTDHLVEAFIEMALTCERYEAYLNSISLGDLEKERRRWEAIVKGQDKHDTEIQIARKNLAVILKRFDKIKEIEHYLKVARGQLSLIENSFQLIADQIITMRSPQELTGQLDELLDGVESIKQAAADTERLLNPLGLKESDI